MIINFRQGIVSYDTSVPPFVAAASVGGVDVTLNVGTQPFVVSVANQGANYLWSESLTIDAWPSLSPVGTYYLYINWNSNTFARTFGTSTLKPIVQGTAPLLPATGQHWYNTTTSQMSFWNGSVWSPVIRLFVAKLVGPNTISSVSINAPGSFQGTTVGDTTPNVSAGMVVFDSSGYPIFKHDGTFFTTEDQVFAEGSAITGVRLESNVFTAQSASPSIIPVYTAVAFNTDGQIYVAGYNDTGTTAIGMALQQINFAGTGAVLLEGTVTNPLFNFAGSVGGLLWVSGAIPGTFQTTDPFLDNPVAFPVQHVPVGRIISPTSFIFLQGIGSKGDPGPSGAAAVPLATAIAPGTVFLSTDSGALPSPTPTVVSELDPRLSNARTPLPHNQAATTITVAPYSSVGTGIGFTGPFTQNALQQIADGAVGLTGSTMTGFLILNADPAVALGAATKQYVDTSISNLGSVYLPLAGGTMTGSLFLANDPSSGPEAATKNYVDNQISTVNTALAGKLNLSGGIMTGAISMNSNQINNLADPTLAQDAATKNYIDTITTLPNLVIPYDIAFFIAGNMTTASTIVGAFLAARAITLPASAAGSLAMCGTAPAGTVVYDVQQNGAHVGSVTFVASTTGFVSFDAQVNLNAGDVFTVVTPGVVDASIANVYITMVGTAVA